MGANIGHMEMLSESSSGVWRQAFREVADDTGTPACAQVTWAHCPLALNRVQRLIVSKAKCRVAWHKPIARLKTKNSPSGKAGWR